MIERFIVEYSERAYQFSYRLCGNAEEAKELVQEAFFRVIKKWDSYDRSQPLENWFFAILRNVYTDSVKRYERRNGLSLDGPAGDEEFGVTLGDSLAAADEEPLIDLMERREASGAVRAALDELRVEYKAILTLCDMQGLDYEEISRVLGCPLGTVRSRVCRARAAFRAKMLEKAGQGAQSYAV